MKRGLSALFGAVALLAAAAVWPVGPARAESCVHRDLIVETARSILSDRPALQRFAQRRYGTDAAFLLIRYADLSERDTTTMLDDLVANRVRMASDLQGAWQVSHLGSEAFLAQPDLAPLAWVQMSTLRALIMADDGQTALRLAAESLADQDQAKRVSISPINGMGIAAITSDFDDGMRLRFARHAEQAGKLLLAASLLGDRVDLSAYHALLDRHGHQDALRPAMVGALWQSGVGLRLRLDPIVGQGTEPSAESAALFRILKASYHDGLFAWLSLVFNQTGKQTAALAAADAYLDALAGLRVDPVRDPETGWLIVYAALLEGMGFEALQQSLSSFDLARWHRHFAGRAATTMDWMIAKHAIRNRALGLSGLLSGLLSERPDFLTDEIDWPRWLRVSASLTDDGLHAMGADDLPIAIELLADEGRWADALALTGRLPLPASMAIRRDLMKRLDRLCLAATVVPGQALLLGGQTLFRFPPRR